MNHFYSLAGALAGLMLPSKQHHGPRLWAVFFRQSSKEAENIEAAAEALAAKKFEDSDEVDVKPTANGQ